MDQQPQFPQDRRSRNNPQTQRGTPSRRPADIPSLDDGVFELYDSVNDAIGYFSHFEQDFRQDIHRIRNYCEKQLLEEVWASKVHPPTSGQRSRRTQHEVDSNFDGPDGELPTFRSTMKQLVISLGGALAAAESFRPSQRRPSRYSLEDAAKIRQQLHRSNQSLRKSLSLVIDRRSEMETVHTELEMLRIFLGRNGAEEGGGGNDPGHVQGGGGRQRRGEGDEGDTQWGGAEEQAEEWGGGQEDGKGEPV